MLPVRRVAFLSSEYPPRTYGGLGTTVEALSRYLSGEGVDVTIMVPAGKYAEPPPGVTLLPIPVEGASSFEDYWVCFCESALAEARRVRLAVGVVHCHDWMTVLGGLAIGRASGVPVVLSIHLPQTAETNQALENIGLAASDGILANSHAVSVQLSERALRTVPITVVPNGVDLARFPYRTTPGRGGEVLFVGRLVPSKGVDVLLRAFGAVLRRLPDATLVISGDGDQRLYLERLARFLGIRDRVAFLGWQPADVLAEHYRSAAVTAVPSWYEPFGLVALEAMASGSPVVVSRTGGLAETVENEISGFWFEPGDHLDLASRLAAVLSDPAFANVIGRAARRRAEEFDWRFVARRTAQLYASLTESARSDMDGLVAGIDVLSKTSPELGQRAAALLIDQDHGWPE